LAAGCAWTPPAVLFWVRIASAGDLTQKSAAAYWFCNNQKSFTGEFQMSTVLAGMRGMDM